MAEAAIRRRLWKTALSLPSPLLRAASGVRPVYAEGRTLDPAFQLLLYWAGRREGDDGDPPFDAAFAQEEPGVRSETIAISEIRGSAEARMLTPDGVAANAPLLVFAYRAGSAGCSLLAKSAGCRMLAVEYRVGEGGRFPAGFDDLMAAYAWARETAARAGTEANPAIGGESLGGGMAAAACLELKRLGQPQPAMQLLLYPALDMTGDDFAPSAFAGVSALAPGLRVWREGRYVGATDDPLDSRISPLRARDHQGLAPAIVVAAGYDPLAGQAEAYARKLRAGGGRAVYRRFDALPHGFAAFAGVIDSARTATEAAGSLAGAALRGELAWPRPGGG
ncbi:MAG: alpha/beta hydrolase fold domain-containing protein [Caulobacteraceae bacterium]